MLVASLYKLRSEMLYEIAERAGGAAAMDAAGSSAGAPTGWPDTNTAATAAAEQQQQQQQPRHDQAPLWLTGAAGLFRVALLNLALAVGAALCVAVVSPAAAGSGIPDVKAYLNGADSPLEVFRSFFTLRTFCAKVGGSALAVASSLCVGKEGPMLHAGSILAVLLGRWLGREGGGAGARDGDKKKEKDNVEDRAAIAAPSSSCYGGPSDLRDLVACGAACGVCTAFRAPVGGVVFAMETSTRWSKELTWRCFLATAVAVLVVRALVAACAGRGLCSQLRWGSLAYMDASYPVSVPARMAPQLLLLSVVGGWLGSMFVALNTWVCLARKKWVGKRKARRLMEVAALSALTSVVLLALPAAVRRCSPCKTGDPRHCVEGPPPGGNGGAGASSSSPSSSFRTFGGGYGCPPGQHNEVAALAFAPQGFLIQALFTAPSGAFHPAALASFALAFFLLAALTYGAMLPSGLFTVALIFGGCLGRLWAEVWPGGGRGGDGAHSHAHHPPDGGLVGMHALLGAAAFLGGLMRMSASACLILMEMTQAPQTLPYLMVTLIISKGVGDRLNMGVFDTQMLLKGLGVIGCGGGGGGEGQHRLMAGDVMSGVEKEEEDQEEEDAQGARQEGKAAAAAAAAADSSSAHRRRPALNAVLRVNETRARVAAALGRHRDARAFAVCAADEGGGAFLGMISRDALLDLMRRHHGSTQQQQHDHHRDHLLDLAPRVEPAPVVVPPSLPLSHVYALMQGQGLEVLPVVREHGPLEGLVTRCVDWVSSAGTAAGVTRAARGAFFLPLPRRSRPPGKTKKQKT
jgi:chloride channel 7